MHEVPIGLCPRVRHAHAQVMPLCARDLSFKPWKKEVDYGNNIGLYGIALRCTVQPMIHQRGAQRTRVDMDSWILVPFSPWE